MSNQSRLCKLACRLPYSKNTSPTIRLSIEYPCKCSHRTRYLWFFFIFSTPPPPPPPKWFSPQKSCLSQYPYGRSFGTSTASFIFGEPERQTNLWPPRVYKVSEYRKFITLSSSRRLGETKITRGGGEQGGWVENSIILIQSPFKRN